ncbi:nicotinate-nucleotide-dimethylbenzimidazole phosphoribosyltransferase [Halopenitus malekzadehii]|uniref:Nicotinate-nucleotide--dimethylbenzimidazole phosphoribosyltransferase n=1 Tax=Halopenitus malekzadehii TaxID=1267564 RepID=A0A1H6IJS7_9EURY|nr:nicotinate-nucleotide--dimethylbenzimidazole phosphoribosyltransferase [Halopenitus malekzadehii]SEH47538.1 nicotinate-nucleotide-dimethylbenzimidazole phosphoribosyltransferase [Halopenitus malekzadehii]
MVGHHPDGVTHAVDDEPSPHDLDRPEIPSIDGTAERAALERQPTLTKPPGSLGRLEDLAVALAGVTGDPQPTLDDATVVVAAGDHGVVDRGVSAYPQAATRAMLENFLNGGAAVNAIADAVGVETLVVDAGIAGDPVPGALSVRIDAGTNDASRGPAMSRADAIEAIEAGVRIAGSELADADVVALGEMGIGNTTIAAAITAALTDAAPAEATGYGTGIDDEALERKVAVVEDALATNGLAASTANDPGATAVEDSPSPSDASDPTDAPDPIDAFARVGGFEVGVLAGVALGCAADRTPVVVDGVISGAAALVANALDPAVRPFLLPSHAGAEPAHAIQLAALGLDPLFAYDLRLGEGTGACLALPIYRSACATHREMATFDDIGLDGDP